MKALFSKKYFLFIGLFWWLAGCGNSSGSVSSLVPSPLGWVASTTDQLPFCTLSFFGYTGTFAQFKAYPGDPVLLNFTAPASPSELVANVEFAISDSQLTNAKTIELTSPSGDTVGDSTPCNSGTTPSCTLTLQSDVFFESITCASAQGGNQYTTPKPGTYTLSVGYNDGTQKTMSLNFVDPCSVTGNILAKVVHSAAKDRAVASVNSASQEVPWMTTLGSILLILLVGFLALKDYLKGRKAPPTDF